MVPYDKSQKQQISVRLPHDLYERIKRYHEQEGQGHLSMNAMVISILEKWMRERGAIHTDRKADSSADAEKPRDQLRGG
jgi:hypothetical protein